MSINWERYDLALKRNLAEVNNAILERRALIGLINADSAHGLDFFRIAEHALFNDLIAHAIKVFDTHKQAASFWYIKRVDSAALELEAKNSCVKLEDLKEVSEKLKHIRDKTHFHIDKEAVSNPKLVWSLAEITGDYLGESLDAVFKILSSLHYKRTKQKISLPDYDGSDAKKIIISYSDAYPDAHIVV